MSVPGVRMKRQGLSRGQRFIKADYYELDWYYDECTDGKAAGGSCRDIQLTGNSGASRGSWPCGDGKIARCCGDKSCHLRLVLSLINLINAKVQTSKKIQCYCLCHQGEVRGGCTCWEALISISLAGISA